jgi:Flp pilus assembly protein TadG
MIPFRIRDRAAREEQGQILVIFAIALLSMLIAAALLFDGAQALVLKRQLQNASDSAALAGANLLQASTVGCSATSGSTTPRTTVRDAARAAIMTNLGWSATKVAANVTVTCPAGYNNYGVSVTIADTSKTYFGAAAGITNIGVGASSIAFNGPTGSGKFSVMQLNPCYNGTVACGYPADPLRAAWANAYQGCPSVSFGGSAKMAFQGSIQVDSACLAANGGAFGVSGNASVICFGTLDFTTNGCTTNGAKLRMVGSWTQGPNIVNPSPLQFQAYVPDPLKSIHTLVTTGWSTFGGGSGTTIGNGNNAQCQILSPGIYNNGINIKAQGSAYLLPGIYVIGGSGITFSGQGALYTIKQSLSSGNCTTFTPDTTWDTGVTATSMCPAPPTAGNPPPDGTCGVLIYNTTGTGNGAGATMGPLDLGGGSAIKLRSFVPSLAPTIQWTSNGGTCTGGTGSTCSGGWLPRYKNIIFWQDRNPVPTSSYHQPTLTLRGGGNALVAGTVYAPSAQVSLGGNCGGGGGIPLDLTLQFISWDLSITGSCYYNFLYNVNSFAQFPAYGLVQ